MEVESHYENLFKPSIEIFSNSQNEWVWTLKTGGLTVATCPSDYKRRSDCVKNILDIEKALRELRLEGKIK